MSNRTVKGALKIHGKDPQELIEKLVRERIYNSIFWKEQCLDLNEDSLLTKATELEYVGGLFSNQKPTPFLCLLLKMLQIQLPNEIILKFVSNSDFKYLTVLSCFYLRLVLPSLEVYQLLEPLLEDFRKIRLRKADGSYELSFIDVIINDLLKEDRVFGIILPRLTKRLTFVKELGEFRKSKLQEQSNQQLNIENATETIHESLTIDATNELRKKLGLQPLRE